MKFIKNSVLVTLAVVLFSCNNQPKVVKSLNSELDSVSYAVGINMSKQINVNFKEINKDAYLQGLKDGLDSAKTLASEKDLQKVMNTYFRAKQMEKMKAQQEKAKKEAEAKFADVKKAGEEFMAKNKTAKDVKTTASGLQYIVLKEGKGENVKPTDRVKIHYHGTTITGEVFDSTVKKNSPYTSSASAFIKGFNEGLSLMKKGSKYKLFIPQDLAYGYQQRGELIKPFSALIFEVEVLDILDK